MWFFGQDDNECFQIGSNRNNKNSPGGQINVDVDGDTDIDPIAVEDSSSFGSSSDELFERVADPSFFGATTQHKISSIDTNKKNNGPKSSKNQLASDYDDGYAKEEKTEATTATTPTTTTTPISVCSLIDEELDGITQQMGKLWWPTPSQDLTKTYQRDKHGRLVPADRGVRGIGKKGLRGGGSSPPMQQHDSDHHNDSSSCYNSGNSSSSENHYAITEHYDKVITSVHAATVDLVGTVNKEFSNDRSFQEMNPKLQTSMALAGTIDKVWAKELYEMDAREREEITNEIHGIKSTRAKKETHVSIEREVEDFRKHLETNLDQKLDNGDSIAPPVTKDAYRRGVHQLKSDYLTSKNFLLKFLRICFYDAEVAALRYFRYLDLLYLLFGDDALTRPLALNDLTKREMRYLKKGQMQLIPSRDRAGRRIYAFSGCDDWNFNIREKYRTNIYLIDVLSDDITTQKLGAVMLSAPRIKSTNDPFGFEGMTLRMGKQELLGGTCTDSQFFRKINEAVPIRFSAIHYFAPRTLIYDIGRVIILSLLGKDHRRIVRFHAGSQLECNYSLRSFGIPHEDVTITEGGNIKTKHVQKFINARRSIETFREKQQQKLQQKNDGSFPRDDPKETCPGIECPETNCVVFGDKTMNGHSANVEFRELLKIMEREREEQLNHLHHHKNKSNESNIMLPIKQFIDSIIEVARSPKRNLRFLVFDKTTNLFVDIDDHNELCKRVSQSLRDQRKRARIEEHRALKSTSSSRTSSPALAGVSTLADTTATTVIPNRVQSSTRAVSDDVGRGFSIMVGLEAAKRLKRSYDNDGSCLFCTHQS